MCLENGIKFIEIVADYKDSSFIVKTDYIQFNPTKNQDKSLNTILQIILKGFNKDLTGINMSEIKQLATRYSSGEIEEEKQLITTHPRIASELHPTKNAGLKASDITANSNRLLWWKCNREHEWEATVLNRTYNHSNCTICRDCKIGKSLLEVNPTFASELHTEINNGLKASDISYGSGREVVWKCNKCGKTWKTKVCYRTYHNSGCPYCREQG